MIQDITGGLEVLAMKGKIKVDNTLEARLGNDRLGPSKILPPAPELGEVHQPGLTSQE